MSERDQLEDRDRFSKSLTNLFREIPDGISGFGMEESWSHQITVSDLGHDVKWIPSASAKAMAFPV